MGVAEHQLRRRFLLPKLAMSGRVDSWPREYEEVRDISAQITILVEPDFLCDR